MLVLAPSARTSMRHRPRSLVCATCHSGTGSRVSGTGDLLLGFSSRSSWQLFGYGVAGLLASMPTGTGILILGTGSTFPGLLRFVLVLRSGLWHAFLGGSVNASFQLQTPTKSTKIRVDSISNA